MELQIIGGGLGGLVTAIAAAERGAQVRLFEAHRRLGGRARTSPPPYLAQEGPHVIYSDGPLWAWLHERELLGDHCGVPASAMGAFFFRCGGRRTRRPDLGLLRVLLSRELAPVDPSFRAWAEERYGAAAASTASAAAGVATYHHDPGQLSARFVHERLRRAFAVPPRAGYLRGGWSTLVARLAETARRRGVRIETGSRVTELPGGGPVVVATSLAAARGLLGEPQLEHPSGSTALLDVAVRSARGDAFVVSDLDEAGWLERFTAADPSLAPSGESLIQVQVPFAPGTDAETVQARAEALLEVGVPGWRDRMTWRQSALARERTGAVDLPGHTWRDRPAIDRGDGVYLVGDQVAAPGLLSEVSFASALRSVELAVTRTPARR